MNTLHSLPPDLERQVNGELGAGETLLWAGQPPPARLARLARPQFWMGIPYTLFALFWETIVVTMLLLPLIRHGWRHTGGVIGVGFGIVFPLFGLIALASGVNMLLSPWKQSRKAERTLYALTNHRALILQNNAGVSHSQGLLPEQLRDRTRTQNRDRSGDLVFPHAGVVPLDETWPALGGSKRQARNAVVPVGFYGIPDVHGVDDLIRCTFEDTRTV